MQTIEFTAADAASELPPPMSVQEVENMTLAQKRMAAMIMETTAEDVEAHRARQAAAEAEAAAAVGGAGADQEDTVMEESDDEDDEAKERRRKEEEERQTNKKGSIVNRAYVLVPPMPKWAKVLREMAEKQEAGKRRGRKPSTPETVPESVDELAVDDGAW